jgi:hypothetical protein
MESQNLKTLFDISIWGNDRHKSWQGWGVGNIPPDLEGDWRTLKLCLQGKAPLKKKGKDERGWGENAKAYTTANGYRLTINVPNAQKIRSSGKLFGSLSPFLKLICLYGLLPIIAS